MAKFDVKAFGLSLGLLWGTATFLMGLTASVCQWGELFVSALSPFYIGYDANLLGSLIGFAWGFVDGGIGGVAFAWLYNKLAKT